MSVKVHQTVVSSVMVNCNDSCTVNAVNYIAVSIIMSINFMFAKLIINTENEGITTNSSGRTTAAPISATTGTHCNRTLSTDLLTLSQITIILFSFLSRRNTRAYKEFHFCVTR